MFRLISDGSCDLGVERAKKYNIDVVPFYVSFDQNKYDREIEEVGIRDFYDMMVREKGVYPKSSMPSVDDYVKKFMPYVKKNEEILCLCITTKFSGSYNSAMNAKNMILEEYPDAVIEVLDTQVNTVLQGILAIEAARMRDAGWSLADTVKRLKEMIPCARILFTVGSMDYLVHGGRAGRTAGIIAGTLGLKPMIVLKEGEIFSAGVAHGRRKSMIKILDMLHKYFQETGDSIDDYEIVVGFGYDEKEAEAFRDMVEKDTGRKGIEIFQIGATIAVHTGPYPLGIGILKKAF